MSSSRIRFLNSAQAAAFIAGIMASKPDDVDLVAWPDLDEIPERNPVLSVSVDTNDREIDIDLGAADGNEGTAVSVVGINDWVNYILRPFATSNTVKVANGNYNAVIEGDRIVVGCKTFSGADLPRLSRAAKRIKGGLRFAEFRTSNDHRIWTDDGRRIRVDNDGAFLPEDVAVVAAAHAKGGGTAKTFSFLA